jgi:hypothetical protein
MRMIPDEKQFAVGMVVSCKRSDCHEPEPVCAECIEGFIDESVRKYRNFSFTQATTGNGSKQFVVSFSVHCRKPDCEPDSLTGACCTASADKCEICLRTIVSRGIHEMYGFHAKEIVIA